MVSLLIKIAAWSKIIRNTFINFLIILTIISAIYFWLVIAASTTELSGLGIIYLFAFSWSVGIVFLSGVVYYIFNWLNITKFKKEMRKVKINVKNK